MQSQIPDPDNRLRYFIGDIRDETDVKEEEWFTILPDGAILVQGAAAVKDINERLPLHLPEHTDYSTLAGFFLFEFGRIPHEKDALDHGGRRFTVEKMAKRHISQIRVGPASSPRAGEGKA